MRTHELTVYPLFFAAIINGKKNFEFRRFKNVINQGDYIAFKEFNPVTRTMSGREVTALVTFVYTNEEIINENYSIVNFKLVNDRTFCTEMTIFEDDLAQELDSKLKDNCQRLIHINRILESEVESDRQFRSYVAHKINKVIGSLSHEEQKELQNVLESIRARNKDDV